MNQVQLMKQLMTSNPMFLRAQEMARGKTPEQLQQIAKNLCQEKGIDFDQALAQFKKQMNGRTPF